MKRVLCSRGSHLDGALGFAPARYGWSNWRKASESNDVEEFAPVDCAHDVSAISCGWGHSACVSSKGELIAFGRTMSLDATTSVRRFVGASRAREDFVLLTQQVLNNVDEPLPRTMANENFVDVACGGAFTLGVAFDKSVFGFGLHYAGQCGVGSLLEGKRISVSNRRSWFKSDRYVVSPLKIRNMPAVSAISAGFQHALALCAPNEVYAWGKSHRGQLGVPEMAPWVSFEPVRVFKDVFVAQVAAGFDVSYVLDDSNVLRVCGKLSSKVFDNEDALELRKVATNVVRVFAGKSPDAVFEYANGDWAQVGLIPHERRRVIKPVRVIGLPNDVSKVRVGVGEFVAVCDSGDVYEWDWSEWAGDCLKATKVDSSHSFEDVALGMAHRLALVKR